MVSHLLKWVHFQQDSVGRDVELPYFRDTDGREGRLCSDGAQRSHPVG
ncbi:MAG: hypothetical protein ACE5JX_13140 [Acidobacteriota bacterium]